MISNAVKNMSTLECLRSMEELWDVLCHNEQEMESPSWHGDVLAERTNKMSSGAAEFISLEDLKSSAYK
jgi:hypothetical protein